MTDTARAKCERDLTRLRRLEMRYRFRSLISRGFRGVVGFVLGLAATFKLKVAATLGGKIFIAALIGLGFAWPAAAITVIIVGIFILALFAACEGGADCGAPDCWCDGNCPDCCDSDCKRKNTRRERLLKMIEEREQWLAKSEGPPPLRYNPHRYQQMTEWLGTLYKSERTGSRRDDPNS